MSTISRSGLEAVLAEDLKRMTNEDFVKWFTNLRDNEEAEEFGFELAVAVRYDLAWLKLIVVNELVLRNSVKASAMQTHAGILKAYASKEEVSEEKNKGLLQKIKEKF